MWLVADRKLALKWTRPPTVTERVVGFVSLALFICNNFIISTTVNSNTMTDGLGQTSFLINITLDGLDWNINIEDAECARYSITVSAYFQPEPRPLHRAQ